MENENKVAKNKEDFYAVVSAITRFIETADDDLSPNKKNDDIIGGK